MPTPEKHALLSASSAHRWLQCTAAPHYEEQFPAGTSEYAEEGTLAHRLCELTVQYKVRKSITKRSYSAELTKIKKDPHYSDEMVQTADAYAEYIAGQAMQFDRPPHIAVEVRVDISDIVPSGFGTCDCIMIGGDTLRIVDYKHGKGVAVSAANNPQMRLYAYGALKLYAPIYGSSIKHISTAIFQPRLSEEASVDLLDVNDLLSWGDSIRPIAQEAYDGPGVFNPGDHCKFCRGRSQCRARAAYFAGFTEYAGAKIAGRLTQDELSDASMDAATGEGPDVLSDEDVGRLLTVAKGLDAWYKDLQDYAMGALLAGKPIPGYKLVAGRSVRSFADADDAIKTLLDAGYDEAMIYDRKPKTLSEIEKMLGKKAFAELLAEKVIKPQGKPTLVPESDKREAYNPGAAEFADIAK